VPQAAPDLPDAGLAPAGDGLDEILIEELELGVAPTTA